MLDMGSQARGTRAVSLVLGLILVCVGVWQYNIARTHEYKFDRLQATSTAILEMLPDAIIVCNLDGRINYCNDVAVDMFEAKSKNDLISKRVSDLTNGEYARRHELVYSQTAERLRNRAGSWYFRRLIQGTAITMNGREFPVTVAVRGIKYGGEIMFVATIRTPAAPAVIEKPLEKVDIDLKNTLGALAK